MAALRAELGDRDLAGHEVFRGPQLTSGYVGEYPYGHHYAAELREVDQEPRQLFGVPTVLATHDLLGEHENAPDDLDDISLAAPAPAIFESAPETLRWDGRSSWVDADGSTAVSAGPVFGGGQNGLTIDRAWLDDGLRAN